MSASVPSSVTTCRWPEITYPTWRCWQDGVPAIGFTSFDQRQPGPSENRPSTVPSRLMTWTQPCGNRRTSSGVLKLFRWSRGMPAIVPARGGRGKPPAVGFPRRLLDPVLLHLLPQVLAGDPEDLRRLRAVALAGLEHATDVGGLGLPHDLAERHESARVLPLPAPLPLPA